MYEPDPETYVLHQCTTALALLDIEKDHQAIVRIFEYLHKRFRDEAQLMMMKVRSEIVEVLRTYQKDVALYKEAKRAYEEAKRVEEVPQAQKAADPAFAILAASEREGG